MAGGFMDKMKDFVKGNPEQAASAIEKVEDAIDERTGGKYAEHVDKGGDALREKLGLPSEQAGPDETIPQQPAPGEPLPEPMPEPGPTPVPEPGPTPMPEPGPAPVPEPGPTPMPEPGPAPLPEPGPMSGPDAAPAPNPQPMPEDPQRPGSIDEPLTPGGSQQPGEPGGPLEEELRPGGQDSTPAGGTGAGDSGLPQGGPTQQGEEHSTTPTPGGAQPDSGGPDAEKQLPPFDRG
jgi:antitoxin protein of toxin-antitoxin system